MNTLFEIYLSILSASIGIDFKGIKKSLDRRKLVESGNHEISDSIDIVSEKLEDSKQIIVNALLEIEKQKKLYEQLKADAELSKQISSLNKEQIDAVTSILEGTLNQKDKNSFYKTFFWNLFFCVLSAVLGFLLGKFL